MKILRAIIVLAMLMSPTAFAERQQGDGDTYGREFVGFSTCRWPVGGCF